MILKHYLTTLCLGPSLIFLCFFPLIFFQVCFSFSFQGISEGISITWKHAAFCTRTHTHKPIIFLIPLVKSLQLWQDYEDITHCKLVEKVPLCHSAHRRSTVVEILPVVWQNTQRYLKHAQQLYPLSHTHTHTHPNTHYTGHSESTRGTQTAMLAQLQSENTLQLRSFSLLLFVLCVQHQSFEMLAVVQDPWCCHSLTNT